MWSNITEFRKDKEENQLDIGMGWMEWKEGVKDEYWYQSQKQSSRGFQVTVPGSINYMWSWKCI